METTNLKKRIGRTAWNKGKTGVYSTEALKKMSVAKKGKKKSEEHKKNISNAKKGDKTNLWKGGIYTEEYHKNQTKKWVKEHEERYKSKLKEWREKNKEKISISGKKWKTENYDRVLSLNNKRRITKLGNGGSHSFGEWELLKKQYNYTCPCCHKSEPSITLSRDHIIALSKGGSDNIENIQPLCRSCNSMKGSKCIRYIC